MVNIIILCVGLLAGFIIGRSLGSKVYGYLRIDHSDPSDPPLLFLELRKDLGSIMKKRTVLFKVKVEDFVSQN